MRQASRGQNGRPAPIEPPDSRPRGEGPPDMAALRRQVSMADVLQRLGYLDALRGSGPQRPGPCPLHDAPSERHRSFSVHLGKGVFRCFHPQCQAQGNTLDLWAAYHRLDIGPAAKSLAQAFAPGLTPTAPSATEKWNP